MAQLRHYQMYEPQMFSGEVNDVFFSNFCEMKPQKISKVIQPLLATNMTTFTTWLQGIPTIKIEDHNEEYYWEIMGSSYINVPLVKAVIGSSTLVTSSTTNVGAGGAKFKLYFPFRWFGSKGIIVGEKNEKYRIEILDEETEGTYDVKICKVTGENHAYGIPGSELVGGKLFSYEYYTTELENPGPDGSRLNFAGTAAMKNILSSHRKDYSVMGREFGRKLYTPIPYKEGNTVKEFTMSMPMVQWKFEQEFEQEFNRMILYGRSNRDEYGNYHDKGQSGNIRKEGAGFFEQKEIGHVIVYDAFSIGLIEEALYQLSVNTLPFDQRVFILRTGERGARQFSDAASAKLSTWQFAGANNFNQNPPSIEKIQSPLHKNAWAFGAQIVEYRGMNGLILRLEIDPAYDDDKRHKIMRGGNVMNGPAFSYRYDIDWVGSGSNGDPNIQLVEVNGWEMGRWFYYGSGGINPWTGKQGPGGDPNDKYGYGRMRRGGIVIKDTLRTVTILPTELAY